MVNSQFRILNKKILIIFNLPSILRERSDRCLQGFLRLFEWSL